MATGTLEVYGIWGFVMILLIALEEVPLSFNVARAERRVGRIARRRRVSEGEALSRLRRSTRQGAYVLCAFATACLVFLGVQANAESAPGAFVFTAFLALGMVLLSASFLFLAPRLLDRVEHRLAASATDNSPPSDAEVSHGPRA